MKEKLPAVAATGVIGSVVFTLITSGIFPTKAEMTAQAQGLQVELAEKYVKKLDLRDDLTEIKTTLREVQKDLEQLKINSAKQ